MRHTWRDRLRGAAMKLPLLLLLSLRFVMDTVFPCSSRTSLCCDLIRSLRRLLTHSRHRLPQLCAKLINQITTVVRQTVAAQLDCCRFHRHRI